MESPAPLTPTALAEGLEISLPYASQLLSGKRPLSTAMAVRIFRTTGHKIGPIEAATDAEIDVLERYVAPAEARA